MQQPILEKIKKKTGLDLARILSEDLSGSELNSLLLDVFDRKTHELTPAALMRQYAENRFVKPAEGDPIALRSNELCILRQLKEEGFEPLELSPAAVLGVCSVLGTVDQKKIISATRGTELLSDATNAMAIHIAHMKKKDPASASPIKYCTTHRHIRTPPVMIKGHTAHFKIACFVTAGRDSGDFIFEKIALAEHLQALSDILIKVFGVNIKYIKLQARGGYAHGDRLIDTVGAAAEKQLSVPVIQDRQAGDNAYYQGIQYKAVIETGGREIEIADGGFVDWTQRLLENRKERFLISGLGIEYLTRIL